MTDTDPLVSVIITTYNRADALALTLEALGRQTLDPSDYEILVTDDGSTDDTPATLARTELPCRFRNLRRETNQGISGGRNLAIGHARGTYLVMMSDDLLVPPEFLARHVEILQECPGHWVVGGMRQLDSLTATPFGRYLDGLERSFEGARKGRQVAPQVWEMTWPTARNLSLPKADLGRTGLFDEQFRNSCEDQDLAERARDAGIGFLYDGRITCLHNDQVGDLARCCRQQRAFGHDGVLFCAKRPDVHGDFEVLGANRPPSKSDGFPLVIKKVLKGALARDQVLRRLPGVVGSLEHLPLPEVVLHRLYRAVIAVHIMRGVREGLEEVRRREGDDAADRLGRRSHA